MVTYDPENTKVKIQAICDSFGKSRLNERLNEEIVVGNAMLIESGLNLNLSKAARYEFCGVS